MSKDLANDKLCNDLDIDKNLPLRKATLKINSYCRSTCLCGLCFNYGVHKIQVLVETNGFPARWQTAKSLQHRSREAGGRNTMSGVTLVIFITYLKPLFLSICITVIMWFSLFMVCLLLLHYQLIIELLVSTPRAFSSSFTEVHHYKKVGDPCPMVSLRKLGQAVWGNNSTI